jgi:hypothetical protein
MCTCILSFYFFFCYINFWLLCSEYTNLIKYGDLLGLLPAWLISSSIFCEWSLWAIVRVGALSAQIYMELKPKLSFSAVHTKHPDRNHKFPFQDFGMQWSTQWVCKYLTLYAAKYVGFKCFHILNSGNARFASAIELSVAANSPPLHSEFLLIELLALQVTSAQCRVPSIHVKVCRGFEAAK